MNKMLTKELINILLSLTEEDREKPVKIWDSKKDIYVDVKNVGIVHKNNYGEKCILID